MALGVFSYRVGIKPPPGRNQEKRSGHRKKKGGWIAAARAGGGRYMIDGTHQYIYKDVPQLCRELALTLSGHGTIDSSDGNSTMQPRHT